MGKPSPKEYALKWGTETSPAPRNPRSKRRPFEGGAGFAAPDRSPGDGLRRTLAQVPAGVRHPGSKHEAWRPETRRVHPVHSGAAGAKTGAARGRCRQTNAASRLPSPKNLGIRPEDSRNLMTQPSAPYIPLDNSRNRG
jgi:hypothetical protein